jgi:hypothetical protein
VKRRAAAIAIATGLLTLGGTAAAHADGGSPAVANRDSSGCLVLFYGTPNQLAVCLFPR